jgi:hypothetical protein
VGGLTILEQLCSVTMLLAGAGTILLLYAGLALERQRQALAGLQRERVRAAYRAHTLRRLLTVAVSADFEPVVVIWGR